MKYPINRYIGKSLCPKTQVLLLGWCTDFEKIGPVNLFEIFSGVANTTKHWQLANNYIYVHGTRYKRDPVELDYRPSRQKDIPR